VTFRCFGDGDPLYERYHDEEWGVPVVGERELFERLSLEAFQSGLSWITILRKRDHFRRAFADFEIAVVADYDEGDVERLLGDAGIVRNRAKIEATIANARATRTLHDQGTSLADLMWSAAGGAAPHPADADGADQPGPADRGDLVATSAAAVALARRLKASGFRFVGPTTLYAAMQACGVVNDHLTPCPRRAEVEALRRAALRRRGVAPGSTGA
jgi:DNA-3-methyladenine glycosylase I